MKIVVLTSETPANIWLVNQLLASHAVAGIVIERRPLALSAQDKADRRAQMFKRHGVVKTVNKLLYNKLKSRFLAATEASTVREAFFPENAPAEYARTVDTAIVSSVNDEACIAFVRRHAPDVIAVVGTTVLKPSVFTLAPKGTINIHTGITPEYRSAEPIFWALYESRPEKVGVTVHYIDKGIDTGAVIYQEAVPVYADDTLASIYVSCIRRGATLYSRALRDIADGSVTTQSRRDAPSRAFFSIDLGLLQYLTFRWRFRGLARRLPKRDQPVHVRRSEAPL